MVARGLVCAEMQYRGMTFVNVIRFGGGREYRFCPIDLILWNILSYQFSVTDNCTLKTENFWLRVSRLIPPCGVLNTR